jgi:putative nucleotidyltransferase with HDIG domain
MKPADETALIGNENPGAQEADSRVDSTRTTAEQSTGAGSPPTARESLGERLRSEEEARIIGSLEPEHRARRLPSPAWWNRMLSRLAQANKELWLILSMLLIAGVANYLVTSGRMVLGFYTLPTLFSAYFYGRRHAVLTAVASSFFIGLLAHVNPGLLKDDSTVTNGPLYDLVIWGGILMVTAYAMGTLYERQKTHLEELRQTYHGLLLLLRQFVSKDKYTENHCYRVSVYASRIAAYLGFSKERIEDVRAASLLHDIGKLDTSRELLYKAARLTREEFAGMRKHVDKGAAMLEPVGGPLHRIIPIILAHHDKYDGSGYHAATGAGIPLEARVITVADVYDALTSDRPYRKAMSPFDAKEIIVKGRGHDFDPQVVDAFLLAFKKREMEVPEIIV